VRPSEEKSVIGCVWRGEGENGDGKRRRDFPDRMGMKGASEGSSPLKALKASSVLTGTRDEGSLREP